MLCFNIHVNKVLCFILPNFLFSLLLIIQIMQDFFSFSFATETNVGITISSPKAFPITESSHLYLIKACNALRHVFSPLKTKEKLLNSFRNCNFLHPKGTYVPILRTYCKFVKKLNYVQK